MASSASRVGIALSLGLVGGLGCSGGEAPHGPPQFSLPSLGQVTGKVPAQNTLPDDVKSDEPLPSKYTDLVAQQSPVRNQGDRGVCTIFTSTALLENLRIVAGVTAPDYSEQFLQWSQKAERLVPERVEASTLQDVMNTLAARGTVSEALWRYEPTGWLGTKGCVGSTATMPTECFTNGDPSAAALAAPREKLPIGRYLRNTAIKDYLYVNHAGVAVGLDMVLSAWSYPPEQFPQRPGAWDRGEVPFPSAKERSDAAAQPRVGHAVLIVGWDDGYGVPVLGDNGLPVVDASGMPVYERGFYIVKNSWDTDYWGNKNPYRAGYGMLSQKYVDTYGTAYVVGLPTGAALPAGGEKHVGGTHVAIKANATTDDALTVADAGPYTSASVQIDIDYPTPSELTVELIHDLATYTLFENGTSKTAGIRGLWNLTGDVSQIDRGGLWTLRIINRATGNVVGTLNGWTLSLM